MDREARKAELEGWIAQSRRNMRRLALILLAAAIVSLGACFASRTVGLLALAIVVAVGICGFWILGAHVTDWKFHLRKLDEPAPPTTVVVMRGRGRQKG